MTQKYSPDLYLKLTGLICSDVKWVFKVNYDQKWTHCLFSTASSLHIILSQTIAPVVTQNPKPGIYIRLFSSHHYVKLISKTC